MSKRLWITECPRKGVDHMEESVITERGALGEIEKVIGSHVRRPSLRDLKAINGSTRDGQAGREEKEHR